MAAFVAKMANSAALFMEPQFAISQGAPGYVLHDILYVFMIYT